MKKISLLLAIALVASSLTACTKKENTAVTTSPEVTVGIEGEAASEGEIGFDASKLQVSALDEKTLQVKLGSRTPYFLELTAFPAYMPVKQDIVEANGEAWAVEASTYVGNGPYKVTDWVPSSHITMVKNDNYWESEKLGPDSIKFSLIEDSVAQYQAFQTKAVQFVDDIPTEELAKLAGNPEYHSDSLLGTYYISFNNQVAPFDNALVRKAFGLAIDRAHIAELAGGYLPAGGWVPPGMNDVDGSKKFREVGGNYYDPSREAYAANLEEAKAALAEAGYPGGAGLPVIEYIYNDTSLHKSVAVALQDMWNELGVQTTIQVQEWNTFLETRKKGQYMAARDGWINDYNDPIGVLDLFVTGGGNNNAQHNNPEYDALIARIKTTGDAAERMTLMHEAEDMLLNNWVFAPIMYYSDPYMLDTALNNGDFWASPLGFKYFMYTKAYPDLNVVVGPDPATIDPALNSAVDGATMILHAFEGLYRMNRDNEAEPAVAQSVDISEDGLTYTFHLRDGVAWSDGTPLTANDFVYSWNRAINPATAADYSYMFDCIAGYSEAVGE